jgi:Lrp/AsnC family transcriptional regulator, leucine-responsive regulatory protein
MNSKTGPDSIDWKILTLLQENARLSNTQISKLVGLSQPAVTGRIQRLEHEGVITGYTARLNPKRLRREILAMIRLKTTYTHLHHCLRVLEGVPEVLEVCRITGEDCFLIKGAFERMAQVEAVVDKLAQFGSVTTSFVLASYPPKPMVQDQTEPSAGKPGAAKSKTHPPSSRRLLHAL